MDGRGEAEANPKQRAGGGWSWVPSLYFAEGIPYSIVNEFSVPMLKRLEVANTEIALYTRLLSLPWVIKPLWSPLVEVVGSKRVWIVATQLLIACTLVAIGSAVTFENFLVLTILGFGVLAFTSATHDVAADGFYIIALSPHDQAWYVGLRSTFYRVAMITGQGLLVILAGWLEQKFDGRSVAWSYTLYVAAVLYALLAIAHARLLPRPIERSSAADDLRPFAAGFKESFASFFRKPHVGRVLAFLLLYRFSEAQLTAMKAPFLLDQRDHGGLAIQTAELGALSGTIGVVMLLAGGILGGWLIAQHGLKAWIWWMAVAINLPNAAYLYLAVAQPESLATVGLAVCLEMFGYGFGFAAYLVYMMYVSQGEHATSHYAICTGFMAAGIMLPGMVSGWIQQTIGYQNFFLWVLISMIPSFLVTGLIPLDANYGKRDIEPPPEPED